MVENCGEKAIIPWSEREVFFVTSCLFLFSAVPSDIYKKKLYIFFATSCIIYILVFF
jgi:hypothetical protein